MPFFVAQAPSVSVTIGSVSEVRVQYGDFVVMIEVAAFMMTISFLASSETAHAASAFGVSTKPARMSTLSRTTSSCARRLATSGAMPPTSLRMISIFCPPTVSPCCFMYSLMPLSICVAVSANWPE